MIRAAPYVRHAIPRACNRHEDRPEIGQRVRKSGPREKNVNRFKACNLTLGLYGARYVSKADGTAIPFVLG